MVVSTNAVNTVLSSILTNIHTDRDIYTVDRTDSIDAMGSDSKIPLVITLLSNMVIDMVSDTSKCSKHRRKGDENSCEE